MDDFSLLNSTKRREQENKQRRETARKVAAENRKLAEEARLKTSALLEGLEIAKREKYIRAELDRVRAEGAPNGGVLFEKVYEAHLSTSLPSGSDRILLPEEVLSDLSGNPLVQYPLMFEVYDPVTALRTHCGVSEFGSIMSLPKKVWECLKLDASSTQLRLRYKQLPRCEEMRLRVPESLVLLFPDFRSLLEATLRGNYVSATVCDVLLIAGHSLFIESLEPSEACCLIDADVRLDLQVIGEPVIGDRREVGSSSEVTDSPTRLYVPSPSSHCIVLESSSDLFVSLPPRMDANLHSCDFMSLGDDQVMLEISLGDIAPFGYESWPPFLTVGTRKRAEVITRWKEDTTPPPSISSCENCGKPVPVNSLELHTIRCLRDFQKCDICQVAYRRKDFASHCHCEVCGLVYQRGEYENHSAEWHASFACVCGIDVTKATLRRHRAEACVLSRRAVCRFCGLSFPVGNLAGMDARDRMMGFASVHEAACGNRTDKCEICGKIERLKDMEFHQLAFHN
jgi:hypothetical protein